MVDSPAGTPPGTRIVVAGALLRDGRLLAARRTAPPHLAGRWELPGGKVEAGETPRDALRRELREELGIEATIGDPVAGRFPLGPHHVLLVFSVPCPTDCEPVALDQHDRLRWLARAELEDVDWLDADLPAVRAAAGLLDPTR